MIVVGKHSMAMDFAEVANAEYVPENIFKREKIPFHSGVLVDMSLTNNPTVAVGRSLVASMVGVKYVTVTYLEEITGAYLAMRRALMRMTPNTLNISTGALIKKGAAIDDMQVPASPLGTPRHFSLVNVEEFWNVLRRILDKAGHVTIGPEDVVSVKLIQYLNQDPSRITNRMLEDYWSFRPAPCKIDFETTSTKELIRNL